MRAAVLLFLAGSILSGPFAASPTGAAGADDPFEQVGAWRAAPAEGVSLSLSKTDGAVGGALRLDFDFQGHAGWAAARRDLPLELPATYEISFSIRGESESNDLEIKLIDESGENVWWAVRREFRPGPEWRRIRLKKRHFSFAWGPAGGGEIRRVAAFEVAVTARAGGRGWIALDQLSVVPVPPAPSAWPAPVASASGSLPGFGPERAVDGARSTAWRSGAGAPASLTVDLGASREFGGLTIFWETGKSSAHYIVETSDDGAAWTGARTVSSGNGGRDDLYLPEAESRWIRLRIPAPAGPQGYGIADLLVRPLTWGESPNAFFTAVAAEAPRGMFPRAFSGEQSYWTVVGVSGDTESALISEDGSVEPAAGSFSVEPFVATGAALSSWADAETRHSLADGDLPIPRITRMAAGLTLDVTAAAIGKPGSATLQVRYRLRNGGTSRRRAKLYLAVRPFQVNPPSQFLNRAGGVAPIASLEWNGRSVIVDGVPRIFPSSAPDAFGAATFEEGSVTEVLATGRIPPSRRVEDPARWASGALAFNFDLAAGARGEVSIELPLHPGPRVPAPPLRSRAAAERLAGIRFAQSARAWRADLDRVVFTGPPAAQELLRTLRTNLAEILIERDGPALRPGTRSYARSWIRDGAMMAAALLRMGHPEAVRSYADWFVRYQSDEGRVPCCVDRRGADAVVENDSHGELIYLIADDWRFTKDAAWLERVFPHVEKAVAWIDRERGRRRTSEYRSGARQIFFGLLPESISHEGYSAKPVHSYWDDFWALKGLKDAVDLAQALGRHEEATRWAKIRDEFSSDLHASIRRVQETRGIDFVAGSADLADFDATSTTIALDPAAEQDHLPPAALRGTFERYWSEFVKRRDGNAWEDYTPYEIRNVGAFVRLGWRDRAHELLPFFLAHRRPAGWNGWSEGVGREERKVRFIGDMPHAWVGSDFIRSTLDLFAWERESDGALVLAAGIPAVWIEGAGISVRGLRTTRGALDYSLATEKDGWRLRVGGGLTLPAGGFALRPPLSPGRHTARVNGRRVEFEGGELVVRELPADVFFDR
ncbi:MAG: discoidin domain-containing protein [Acidobacteriota bacterium]|nr:discoidin domain-containing protein [Acidobacteriota bacterium]